MIERTLASPERTRTMRWVVALVAPNDCLGCLACARNCARGAIRAAPGRAHTDAPITIDEGLCTGCGDCVEACSQEALALTRAERT